jgi:E3 ubiquitin-protein ligase HERC2
MFLNIFYFIYIYKVWTWGKGEYYRLGLGRGEHVRRPTLVNQLKLVSIDYIAVGTLHCIAVTTQGDVSYI